jgi:hypothetical protein
VIDHRTPLARPIAEKLPESARKPVRKVNAARERSPGYGEARTSRLETNTERNAVRATTSPRGTGADAIGVAHSTMRPEEFEVFVRRLTAAVPR